MLVLRRTSLDNRLANCVAGRDTFGTLSVERIAASTMVAIMLFAAIQGEPLLGFDQLATLVSGFLVLTGQIILFAGSMAPRTTRLANENVDLAFGITFGAVAVVAALVFGLGSRETAGRFMEDWTRQFQRRQG